MKVEAWIFIVVAVFFALVTPTYWIMTEDWTGTSALVMTFGLVAMVGGYLAVHASKMDARPEDRKDAEVAEGAGELGFFPPYSWWPLWCAATLGIIVAGTVFGWWMMLIGFGLGAIAAVGWVFEYYRGEHAH